MTNLLTLLGLFGPIALIIALLVMALLSQRLGAVTKRAKNYRWFYVAIALIGLSIIVRLLTLGLPSAVADDTDLLYSLPLAAALTLSVFIAWRYWGWLLSERRAPEDKASEGKSA